MGRKILFVISLLLLVGGLIWGGIGVAAEEDQVPQSSSDCAMARGDLDAFFKALPSDCVDDSDCDAFYVGAHSCEGPVVLKKESLAAIHELELQALQEKVRATCYRAPMPACSAIVAYPKCQSGHCLNDAP